MPIDDEIKAEVMAALRTYAEGYSMKDMEKVLALTAPDYFGFGSGQDETVSNQEELKAQLKRDFAQSGDLSMEIGATLASAEGNVAWSAGECTITAFIGGKACRYEGRMSTVMKKVDGRWIFAHTHFAMPDRGQETGQSFSTCQ